MPDAVPIVADPFARFNLWLAEAEASESTDPNAMIVVTATPDGKPSARAILLKGVDDRGFVFYTNKESRKSAELAANPAVFLLFYWKSLARQIRIEGRGRGRDRRRGRRLFRQPSADFAARRLGVRPVASVGRPNRTGAPPGGERGEVPGEDIPRPPYWSGYRVIPSLFEFWQGMDFRLHDRTTYTRVTEWRLADRQAVPVI